MNIISRGIHAGQLPTMNLWVVDLYTSFKSSRFNIISALSLSMTILHMF